MKLFTITFDTDDQDWYVMAEDEEDAKNQLLAHIKDRLAELDMADFTGKDGEEVTDWRDVLYVGEVHGGYVPPKPLYGVYKAYKEGCSDSEMLWFFRDEEEAKQAVEKLQKLKVSGKDTIFAYSEGWEFRGRWTYAQLAPKPMTFAEFDKITDDQIRETEEEFGPQGGDDGEEE